MTGLKIDLEIIQGWVRKWEKEWRTASQVAAVMLAKVLAENEARASRVERLMNEIVIEENILNRIEKKAVLPKDATGGVAARLSREWQTHKKRMTAILREAEALLKESVHDQTIQVGALLFEIGRPKPARGEKTQGNRQPVPIGRT